MKTLPHSPPPPHAFRSSLRSWNRSCEIKICSDGLRTVNLSSDCAAAAEEESIDHDLPRQSASFRSSSHEDGVDFSGYGDGQGFCAEEIESCSPHTLNKASANTDSDDDDGMQWANALGPLQTALRSSGYGVGKGFYAAKMATGKGKEVKIPCKLASFPCSIARQQHAGPIKPNSGPFSGPLTGAAKPNSVIKAHMARSVVPVNLIHRKVLGFDVCEPMSPEVTCLGRIKIKESTHNKVVHATIPNKPGAITPKVEKGRCFDTKNQLCGRKVKGRKKKKTADKSRCLSRRRRFASKEAADCQSFSSSLSLGLGETRREKAAALAESLMGLLEDMRRLEKDKINLVPSVPPPNSLLLMRGGRIRDESSSSVTRNVDESTGDDVCISQKVEARDEKGLCEANVKNLRYTAPLRLSLLDLIDMEDEEFSTSEIGDAMIRQRTRAKVKGTSVCVRENFEAVENADSLSPMKAPGVALWQRRAIAELTKSPGVALWQRRAIAELTPIKVEQRTKQKIKQSISR